MKSHPDSDAVLDGLGDKAVDALRQSVAQTAEDLATYRKTFPLWVAQASERGLANWLHDRAWSHLLALLDGVPGVTVYDKEPKREITFGITYRVRIKRHHEDGQIGTYPTTAAEDFFAQGPVQLPLDGMEEIRLAAGYEWDRTERAIGNAVLTLRAGVKKVIWKRPLPPWEGSGEGAGSVHLPTVTDPTSPTIIGPSTDQPMVDESGE